MQIYIIEHLEPEIYPWCLIEYKNISRIVGKNNLWFANINKTKKNKNLKELAKYGKIIKSSVTKLNLKNVCILDPQARKLLTPRDAKSFDYFVFGGILGDYPPRKRTTPELTSKINNKVKRANNIQVRNIGKKQFSTDNAVLVTKKILEGKTLKNMKFVDKITIKINKIESIDLPFCYPIINGKPQISKELTTFLKNKRSF